MNKEELKKEIERAEGVIADICADIREAKEDYEVWVEYKQRLEYKLTGIKLPEPTRKVREREE